MVDVRLLGSVEALDGDGEVVALGGGKQRALLALLALRAPDVVPTDAIIDAIWADSSASRPEAALHMSVSRLRAGLGEDRVVREASGYRLDVPVPNVDLHRFRGLARRALQLHTLGHPARACESFRQALDQWRGRALSDVRDFDFAEQAARHLEEERIVTVEHLMDSMLAAGEHDLIVGELFGLVESYPYRERMWELLMLALYRSGRQTEALEAFKRLRLRLGEEMGLEPSPDLVELEERILLHDPALSGYQPVPVAPVEEIEYVSFQPGESVVEQGESASAIYWIEEGRVEVLKTDERGGDHRLAELGPGRYFGELAATLGTRRTATVRALVPTTVSVHDLASLRARLGSERQRHAIDPGACEVVRDLIRRGEYLQAFDTAATNIDHGDVEAETRYLAVLALARAGATSQARKRYHQYGLDSIDPSAVPKALWDDIGVLEARLDKDEALSRPPGEERTRWARQSASGYRQSHERTGDAYHAVNAATLALVAGDSDAAMVQAQAVLDDPGNDAGGTYWDFANVAEASLVIGDQTRARRAIEDAAAVSSGEMAKRAVTLKQLRLVCHLKGIETRILAPLWNPRVIHFCGHRILPAGRSGRFPASREQEVRDRLVETLEALDVGVGFGSLAAGSDILAAEALLDRGAELNVVLPFGRDEFLSTSVAPAGPQWVDRFERCLAGAAHVEIASRSEYLDDPVMFDYCSRIAMGEALIRARHLETTAHQVAVWDGLASNGAAGTAADVRTWSKSGAPSTVIEVEPGEDPPGTGAEYRVRSIRALVFGDFAGFSRLTDAQLVRFQEAVMEPIADLIAPYRSEMVSGRTWGDGLYLVFRDVATAAECALDLIAAVGEMDMASRGVPQLRGLRIAAHAAPVFEGWDPISGTNLVFGAGVTQTARIEPRTPEGEIYTTKPFAALAMLDSSSTFDCQYVGTLPTAKQFGDLPLYALRRSLSS